MSVGDVLLRSRLLCTGRRAQSVTGNKSRRRYTGAVCQLRGQTGALYSRRTARLLLSVKKVVVVLGLLLVDYCPVCVPPMHLFTFDGIIRDGKKRATGA